MLVPVFLSRPQSWPTLLDSGGGYQTWYSWPPSSYTVAPQVTMPATWITKALCHRDMENNDGHDSNIDKSDSLAAHWGNTKIQTLKMDVGTRVRPHTPLQPDAFTQQDNEISSKIHLSLSRPAHNTPWFPKPIPASPPTVCLSITKGITQVQKYCMISLLMQFSKPGFTWIGTE